MKDEGHLLSSFVLRHSLDIRHSTFVIRHSSFDIRHSTLSAAYAALSFRACSGLTTPVVVALLASLVFVPRRPWADAVACFWLLFVLFPRPDDGARSHRTKPRLALGSSGLDAHDARGSTFVPIDPTSSRVRLCNLTQSRDGCSTLALVRTFREQAPSRDLDLLD